MRRACTFCTEETDLVIGQEIKHHPVPYPICTADASRWYSSCLMLQELLMYHHNLFYSELIIPQHCHHAHSVDRIKAPADSNNTIREIT